MTTLFVGDIHGCPDELAALLELAQADRVILLGDLFTKGPDPLGVWRILRALEPDAVRGNHDQRVIDKPDKWDLPDEAVAWLDSLPLFLQEDDWIAVHAGVNPERGPAGTDPMQAMNMRRWPGPHDERFWWELWQGPQRVIYGHDAVRGLRRTEVDGRMVALGLDTGCVYGGALSGWILEQDRVLQVPAARTYHDPFSPRRGAAG